MSPEEFHALLKERGVSQRKLAGMIGLDYQHLNKMARGLYPIRKHHEMAIKCALGVCNEKADGNETPNRQPPGTKDGHPQL